MTVTRGLLEHVFSGHKTILATELDEVNSLMKTHGLSLIVATLDASCLKILKKVMLIPILIVANAASSEPFDADLVRQCTKLGGAFVCNLETTSLRKRAFSLIRRFQGAQSVVDELELEGQVSHPTFSQPRRIAVTKSSKFHSWSNKQTGSKSTSGHSNCRKCPSQNSPRTSLGLSRRHCAPVLNILKDCLDISSGSENLRSVRDIIILIEQYHARVSRIRGRKEARNPPASHFKKGLRKMLAPKGVDILVQNKFKLIPLKLIRSSALGTLLRRGHNAYMGGCYEEACALLDLAVLRHPKESIVYFWRALAGANLGFYVQAIRDFDRALAQSPLCETPSRLSVTTSGMREQHRHELELAIRFNRSVACVSAQLPIEYSIKI